VPATPGRRAAEPATSGSTRATAAARARAETRGRLLAAGEALFAERGLHGVTTHDIAAHAGVAAGTFYNHFSDKGALFREITAEAMRELDERLQVGGHPERGMRESVRDHAEALVSFATDHRDLIRILFSREGDAAEAQADVLASLAARLEDGRRLAIERGEMPEAIDAGVLAQAVVGMWARVLAWWADDPDRIPGDRVVETLSQIQLTGTHPPRPSGPNAPSSRQPASG
jgi:AcrR family transcriptional regulator